MDSHPDMPWQPPRPPCGFLYNTGSCPRTAICQKSHLQRDINHWRRFYGKQTCKHGETCGYLTDNSCLYYHPTEQQQLSNSKRRPAKTEPRRQKPVPNPDNSIRCMDMVSGLTDAINMGHPGSLVAGPLAIQNERVLASYNKLADNKIAVPGCPPQFVPPTHRLRLDLDMGDMGSDSKFPTYIHGLEPLVRAVQCMEPAFDVLSSCDVLANAGSIYHLFHFLTGVSPGWRRADIEWKGGADGTLLMQQWNDDPDHKISYGYGRNFSSRTCHYPDDLPEALKESFTYHRVLYYELGGLRFVLHCEADGFYGPLVSPQSTPSPPPLPSPTQLPLPHQMLVTPPASPKMSAASRVLSAGQTAGGKGQAVPPNMHRLGRATSASMYGVSPPLSPSSKGSRFSVLYMEGEEAEEAEEEAAEEEEEKGPSVRSDTLAVDYPCGRCVPADRLVEIKTYSLAKTAFRRQEPEAQLYFGRCSNLYEAGHTSGHFKEPNMHASNTAASLQIWEKKHQDGLAKLVAFIQRLRTLASASAARGQPKLCLVLPSSHSDVEHATLYVRREGPSFLPDEL